MKESKSFFSWSIVFGITFGFLLVFVFQFSQANSFLERNRLHVEGPALINGDLTIDQGELSLNTGGAQPPPANLYIKGSLRIDSGVLISSLPNLIVAGALPVNISGGHYYFPLYSLNGLVYGQHTTIDCISAGGTVLYDDTGGTTGTGNRFCGFNIPYCSGSWRQYDNWSQTKSQYCWADRICPPSTSCTTDEHPAWANVPLESCVYNDDPGGQGCAPYECDAITIRAGCY